MNELVLAVAGGGKTQSIIDACIDEEGPHPERTIAITFTRTGQRELTTRLRRAFAPAAPAQVSGWYSFLQREFVRPYLPRLFPGERLRGFSFDGDPGRFAQGRKRFLDSGGRAYKLHLAKLAHLVDEAASGAPIDRIERIYTHIFIDEVQDLVGWDLEILDRLLQSKLHIRLVGDLRQSLIETNSQDQKNKQFRGIDMIAWFKRREGKTLAIRHQTETHRCNQPIADFADSIFGAKYGFKQTKSQQSNRTAHDGVFAVAPELVPQYVETYEPQCLRHSRNSAKSYELAFRNFGDVKGLTFDRVLIAPTSTIEKFLTKKVELASRSACGLYVGATRARYSVAIILSHIKAKAAALPVWVP